MASVAKADTKDAEPPPRSRSHSQVRVAYREVQRRSILPKWPMIC